MESTKEMKNIKPAYAVRLGTGVFVGANVTYQCQYCGKKAYTPNKPHNTDMMPCAKNRSYHNWIKC